MSALVDLDEEERYLYAIFSDVSGLDLAEFCWDDPESDDDVYRAWDYQWCFTGETKVMTRDGVRPIRDLVGKATLLTESSQNSAYGEWVDADVEYFGQQRIVEIDVERYGVTRTIRTTAQHRWFVRAAEKDRRAYQEFQTRQLQPGMFLRGVRPPRRSSKWINRGKEYEPREWQVVAVRETDVVEDVFCAVVPEKHSFVLDGYILTGNCWYSCLDTYQADQGARSTGKTVGITMRAFAFPFNFPGQAMLITAPELNHLRPLTSAIEARLENNWMGRQMRPMSNKMNGIVRQPHWECRFINGARLISRLPNRDGRGVKGMHVIAISLDEGQDYPLAGWIEIVECLNRGLPGASWSVHGVPRGVRDRFYEITMGEDDTQWTVHRPMAMNRPSWSPEERSEKERTYGGSRQAPDYKRNVYGEHGDAVNALFVLSRLMSCVDQNTGSEYNTEIYKSCVIRYEDLKGRQPLMLLDLPGIHKSTWTLAPKGYSAYFGGMDVGATSHPSEILLVGQRAGVQREQLDLLLRVHMQRISMEDQEEIVATIFRFYASKMTTFGIDKTGIGFPIWERLSKRYPDIVKGYNFSSKIPVALEERKMERGETVEDLVIARNPVEFASDALREVVDAKGLLLPNDRELLLEWQGQNYTIVKSAGNPYGKREYSQGKYHTLDAGKMLIAAKRLATLDEMLDARPVREPVLDAFVGAF